MVIVLVSAVTGALKPLLGKLADLLEKEYKLFKGVRGEIMFLKAELEAMHAFLEKMSEVENPDVQTKHWMMEVRELSYDIEDSIDEFMLCAHDESAKTEGLKEFIERSVNLVTKTRTRCRIAKGIQGLKALVKEVGDRRARYKIDDTICKASNLDVDPRVCSLYKDVSELVGIAGPKGELIELLKGRGVFAQQLKVVSIVGLGGLGKTTLANQVYRTYGERFEHRAFVSVSRRPNMVNIFRTILSQMDKQENANAGAWDEQQIINKIGNFLQDKRYFIVVDDVWNAKTWDIIKCAFSKNNCGSRIITTTRINEVAESCCSSSGDHIYKLRPLSDVDSRRLFLNRIFGSQEQCPSHLRKVSDKILKKCGGLPLAIIAISGLLSNKARTEDQWDQVQNSIGNALERNSDVEVMMKILSLSYFDLPHQLKTCLLFLSIFPEDYAIENRRLVRQWIAEGFIHEEHGHTLYELGQRYVNELINRSLIQPVKIDMYGQVEICGVHDIILDFIVYRSVEENFVALSIIPNLTLGPVHNKVRRLSLQDNNEQNVTLLTSPSCHHARSLVVFGCSVRPPCVSEYIFLRVLDLEDCQKLEQHHLVNIGKLFQLKYLSLKRTKISELPEQIGELQRLETLDLTGTYVKSLPTTSTHLGRLAHLLIDRDVTLPDGIGQMKALEVLEHVEVFKQSTNCVQELGRLTNLRELTIYLDSRCAQDEGSYKQYKEYLAPSLCKLGTSNLRSLSIYLIFGCEDVLLMENPWCPAPRSLRKFIIKRFLISRVPNWMGSLVNLQRLHLEVNEVEREDIQILGGMPTLLFLVLYIEREAADRFPKEQLLKISGSHGFPCLRYLEIGGGFCSLGLMFEPGSMRKLKELVLSFDADGTGALTNGEFDFGIHHLSFLTSVQCEICRWGESLEAAHAAETALMRAASIHPNHPMLVFL